MEEKDENHFHTHLNNTIVPSGSMDGRVISNFFLPKPKISKNVWKSNIQTVHGVFYEISKSVSRSWYVGGTVPPPRPLHIKCTDFLRAIIFSSLNFKDLAGFLRGLLNMFQTVVTGISLTDKCNFLYLSPKPISSNIT